MLNRHYSSNTLYNKNLTFIFVIFFILSNCNSNTSLKDTNWQVLPEVVLADNLSIYILDNRIGHDLSNFYKKDLRLHVYVNANCNTCIDKLKNWEKIISGIKSSHDILFHVFSFDFNNFSRLYKDLINVHDPCIYGDDRALLFSSTHLDINLEQKIILTNRSNKMIDFSTLNNIDDLLKYQF